MGWRYERVGLDIAQAQRAQVLAEVLEAKNGDWAATGGRWQSQITVTIAVIITVASANKRKMILWQSLHVEVNGDTHGQASASGDGDQH